MDDDELFDIQRMMPPAVRNRKELYEAARAGFALCITDRQLSVGSPCGRAVPFAAVHHEPLPIPSEEAALEVELRDAVAARLGKWRAERAVAVDLHPRASTVRDPTKEPLTLENPKGALTNYEIRATQPPVRRSVSTTLERKPRPELRRSKHYPRPRKVEAPSSCADGNGKPHLQAWKVKVGIIGTLAGCQLSCAFDENGDDAEDDTTDDDSPVL
jgi:hypothetical protein